MDRIEAAAAASHEANKFYCMATGDDSQTSWDKAPEWQRDSARAGVQAILDNPDMTPEQSHESWLAVKEKDGWIVGPKKDVDAKTHPCMVPYDQLPREQQMKDHVFQSVARALLEALKTL